MEYPRLLVLSNNSFSKSNSNGRTLGSLLQGWPKDKIAQFCISSDGADFDVCENYFCVTDGEMLNATKHFKPAIRNGLKQDIEVELKNPIDRKKTRKTTLTMLARNFLWNLGIWRGNEFSQWTQSFKPQIILLQSGDSYFMHLLALKLSSKFGAKLAVFNTEGYYFFSHDYFSKDNKFERLFYPFYRYIYNRVFKSFMSKTVAEVYCNNALKHDYDLEFRSERSFVCYTGSEITFRPAGELSETPTFAYLGNLGLKRPEALAEFAEVLSEVAPACHIDVYGKLPADYDGIFDRTPGIVYHGMVSYDKVKEVIGSTDFLLHVEKDDPVLTRELRYAFSTKIADSICSGRNFIVYAPASLACSKYINDTGAAWLASTKTELRQVLETVLTDREARSKVLSRAHEVAEENHSAAKNSAKFQEILCSISKDQ